MWNEHEDHCEAFLEDEDDFDQRPSQGTFFRPALPCCPALLSCLALLPCPALSCPALQDRAGQGRAGRPAGQRHNFFFSLGQLNGREETPLISFFLAYEITRVFQIE